jgi:Cu-Zn family superoxide dismutase
MPNLKADASGRAEFEYRVSGLSLGNGAANDAVGRSVIVHRDADDFQSQPAGNAGPRIACGVIRRLAE